MYSYEMFRRAVTWFIRTNLTLTLLMFTVKTKKEQNQPAALTAPSVLCSTRSSYW